MSEGNSGIQITGGSSVSAMNIVTTPHAPVIAVTNSAEPQSVEELRAQLRALVAELDRQPVDEEVKTSASDAARELDKPEPSRRAFIAFLETVAAGVGAVTGLADKVEPLLRAARAIL